MFIKKGNKVVYTTDPNEVTKENFVCEPGAENRVWCKLEKYEYDKEGNKETLILQVRADNPGDFNRFAPNWQKSGITITMLHDPRPELKGNGVAEKLAKLNAELGKKGEASHESEAMAENEKGKTK